ncbi:dipeptidyl aminopeptidase/acylaminoacyl peptidase [Pseudoduganella flava]|uniref:Dipeptidyl aminopeptidase/acylaminoacyl peptidase n=1 Tax=Pseudoduganella flava TaxID=871742 RepID=A0A562PJV0_9BURK|nr:S9 family peptidase [Pseudoduganella flava]QGZ42220.1 prolyl oligopeptidase family serine peptidase [Pseudoduganella flava]TWI44755.1 dipeptidyl aminopeptidase/acylaminoacyl peptidase [Pseudoduganella flava]
MTLRLLVTGVALATATSAFAAPRGLTIEDLASMDRVASPVLSPDGTRVVYTVRSTNMEKNRGITQLWMIDLRAAKPAPQQLTSHDSSSFDPEWSASGDAIYFLSGRSGSSQVWRLPIGGGEAVKVTNLPLDVDSFHVSPKGDRLAVTLAVFRDCADLACTQKRNDAKAKDKATGKLYDQLFVRHWDTWADGKRNVLYSVPLGTMPATTAVSLSGALDGDITSKPFGDRGEYTFSPDGQRIVFSVRVAGKSESWSTNFDLYDVPAAGGTAPRNLTADNPAWDTKPQFSPDGKTLAYLAMKRPGFEADRYHMILQDVATGKKRVLAESWDRSIADYRWRPDGKALLANADDIGNHKLFSLDVASGKVTALTDKGYVAEFDAKRDTVVYAQNSLADGAQLYKLAGGKAVQLTQANRERLADVKMGEYEQFSFTGANGETVYGHVMKPWNAVPGQKYPVAFLVHGGPQGSFGNSWSYRWNPQVYAGAGYATVFIDFHGSTGYGQAFTDSISGDWGGKPLEDLKKGLAAAGQKYPWLDTSNACALGASYGGYMMNWIQGNWSDGFKCIVNHDGVFDQRGMGYSTEELWFTEWENGGTYYANPEGYEKFNPVHHVTKWKTPMLVIQGDLDFRIPTAQALGAFTALQRRGIESKLLVFPDENHWVLKPANSILWHHTVIGWLDDHLKK